MTKQEAVGLFVLGIMLGAAAMVLLHQFATNTFDSKRRKPADLDWVWGLNEGRLSLDTAAVWRRASRLVSRERQGATNGELLDELDGIEDAMAVVGARLLKLRDEDAEAIHRRIGALDTKEVA